MSKPSDWKSLIAAIEATPGARVEAPTGRAAHPTVHYRGRQVQMMLSSDKRAVENQVAVLRRKLGLALSFESKKVQRAAARKASKAVAVEEDPAKLEREEREAMKQRHAQSRRGLLPDEPEPSLCANCGEKTAFTNADPLRRERGWCVACFGAWLASPNNAQQPACDECGFGIEPDGSCWNPKCPTNEPEVESVDPERPAAETNGRPRDDLDEATTGMDLLVKWAEAEGIDPDTLLVRALDAYMQNRVRSRRTKETTDDE